MANKVFWNLREDQIGILTLSDPDNLNAMGEEMALEFAELVATLKSKRDKLRGIIMTGAGRAFSAGGDLAMLEHKMTLTGEENRLRMLDFYHAFLGIRQLEIPLIAAINGHAIGAGLCLACACDLRIASNDARLGFTFAKLGLHPGMGGTYLVPKIIGLARTTELMITGRTISADEGLRIGLVSRVVTPEWVLGAAQEIVKEILSCGPSAVRQVLETLRGGDSGLECALEREALAQSLSYASAEFREGVNAIREKRSARFD